MNTLFNRLNPQPQQMGTAQNPITSMFGNFANFQSQFNQFSRQMANTNPQQAVQNLLNSGQMSQEQFNQLSQMANMITGKRQF